MKRLPSEVRFWTYVDRSGGIDACWPWLKGRNAHGYGKFGIGGRTETAHRLAWEFSFGPIPKGSGHNGTCVCHRCDNPSCANPRHLFLGTDLDNVRDRDAKRRTARGDRNGSRLYPDRLTRGDTHWTHTNPEGLARGDRNGSRLHPERLLRGDAHRERCPPRKGLDNGRAKLTEENVRQIRITVGSDERIARMFGVSKANIYYIRRRLTWTHVKDAPDAPS